MLMIFSRLPKIFWFKNPSQKHIWIQHHPQTKRKKLPFDWNWVFHLNFLFKETAGRKFNQFILNKIWSCRCHCANITMQKRLSTNNGPQGSRPPGLYRFHAQASWKAWLQAITQKKTAKKTHGNVHTKSPPVKIAPCASRKNSGTSTLQS